MVHTAAVDGAAGVDEGHVWGGGAERDSGSIAHTIVDHGGLLELRFN